MCDSKVTGIRLNTSLFSYISKRFQMDYVKLDEPRPKNVPQANFSVFIRKSGNSSPRGGGFTSLKTAAAPFTWKISGTLLRLQHLGGENL